MIVGCLSPAVDAAAAAPAAFTWLFVEEKVLVAPRAGWPFIRLRNRRGNITVVDVSLVH